MRAQNACECGSACIYWGQAIPATAILSAIDLIGISDLDARSCPHQKATALYGTFSVWFWWRVLEYT